MLPRKKFCGQIIPDLSGRRLNFSSCIFFLLTKNSFTPECSNLSSTGCVLCGHLEIVDGVTDK